MNEPRISASSYSNTAPLIWSFLYGANHGKVELILDNAPSRSAELLLQDRVDAALVPVIASQLIGNVKVVPNVCVGSKQFVRSVCLLTKGAELEKVKSVSLDISSRTSVILTKIIFREFLGFDPAYRDAEPNIETMLAEADAALIIGDPALSIADLDPNSKVHDPRSFDLAEIWHRYTGFGFVFAMWMTRRENMNIDFASARDEGIAHLDSIAANYAPELNLEKDEMFRYLSENISYSVDGPMGQGMDLFFELAAKHKLIPENKPVTYLETY